ncbi:helix-turn-helix domain-containing protein [Hyphomicrobium sp. LHD-15]|uniref:helix-turn-helix transcriptional regulator n=1 Tax=Hyphomicrobium sp. LHD-15 TaxID=3072142 RepID=UPI0028105092|nr:helix-turn-helix domain-containing protein [Hyphomicrobium sp. LHD-15]MDQ8698194.1 helix-turn-helix domain-containing protein [Hyphomicrobium sp. LHD-15]
MDEDWKKLVRRYRIRHGLSQARMADLFGVAQRTVSRWERGEDSPGITQQKRLRDLGWEPSSSLMRSLSASISHCPAPRALTRSEALTLQRLSGPALAKRPSMADWVGRDLAPIACGVLEEILDDRILQRAIANGEIQSLVTTTRSVLKSAEHEHIGLYRTTITYFFHEGTLYNDAIGVPAPDDAACGYRALPMDDAIFPA